MVRVAIVELPIQFTRNLPRVKIQFDEETSQHNGKLVNIVLRNTIPSSLDTWTFTHLTRKQYHTSNWCGIWLLCFRNKTSK